MARTYDVLFVSRVDGDVKRIAGRGNTKASAERSARRTLRERVADSSVYYARAVTHRKEQAVRG